MSGKPAKKPARRLSAAELTESRRGEIADSAIAVFAEHGYRDASIAQIAAKMGAGHGTIYRYFDNKRAIAEYVLRRALIRLMQVVTDEPPEASDTAEQYRDQTARIGRALYDLIISEPDLGSVVFFVAGQVDSEMGAQVRLAFDLVASATEKYLLNGIEKGYIEPDLDTFRTASAIVGMIFEGARRVHLADDQRAEGEQWAATVVKLMFDGIVAK
ncbi:MAG: TetR/AcrR family transcriptional regulator [Actinobacteria bacterium]|nr:TetR/AcrR family transcriptional regulator [Actinomycetota bacterium]